LAPASANGLVFVAVRFLTVSWWLTSINREAMAAPFCRDRRHQLVYEALLPFLHSGDDKRSRGENKAALRPLVPRQERA
jgi:hypothetical protein